jgi:hypothetical protein
MSDYIKILFKILSLTFIVYFIHFRFIALTIAIQQKISKFNKYKITVTFGNAMFLFTFYIMVDVFFILLFTTLLILVINAYKMFFLYAFVMPIFIIDLIFLIKLKKSDVKYIVFGLQGYSIEFKNKIVDIIFSISWLHVIIFLVPCVMFLIYHFINNYN